MDFIVQTPSKTRPKAPDMLTVLLFEVSPELTYRWIEDYGKTGDDGQLNSIRHLTKYWKRRLESSGEHQAADSLQSTMSQQSWLQSFRDNVLPVIRNNRKVLTV